MVRKYRLKIGGMPHSRREREFYLKAFRHHLLAQPPAEIVRHLNAPGPTVRRALQRLRLAMVNSTALGDYMRALSEAVQSKYTMLYEDIFTGTWNSYSQSNRISLKEVDQCLRACRLTLKPNEFRRKYLKYYVVPLDEYAFIAPTVADHQEFIGYLNNALNCRYCVMKHVKDSYRAVFSALPHVYLDYMHYFSTRRIVDPSYNQLLQLHLDATTVSMANEIYMKVYMGAAQAHGPNDKAKDEFLEYFLQTTEQMFELIEKLDVKELKFQ